MKISVILRHVRAHAMYPGRPAITLLQSRHFDPDFVPRDPKSKPKRYKYPEVYEPYGPRPPPSDKIVQLADRIAALSPEELRQIGPTLRERLKHPKLQSISTDGLDLGSQGGAPAAKVEEKKADKTAFDVGKRYLIPIKITSAAFTLPEGELFDCSFCKEPTCPSLRLRKIPVHFES